MLGQLPVLIYKCSIYGWRLLRFGEDSEHVHVPLSEFMDPVRDVVKRLRVHNNVVEPFLKREIHKHVQNKEEDEHLP